MTSVGTDPMISEGYLVSDYLISQDETSDPSCLVLWDASLTITEIEVGLAMTDTV